MSTPNVLYVRTATQAALFECELQGQLSDGYWENARPYDHWQPWCRASVLVGDTVVGRTFYAGRTAYGFDAKALLDVVARRMIGYARVALVLGLDVARALHAFHAIDCDGRIDWTRDYVSKQATIGLLDIAAIDKALQQEYSYTPRDLRRDLRELKATIKVHI
jgi:hypothetical protein